MADTPPEGPNIRETAAHVLNSLRRGLHAAQESGISVDKKLSLVESNILNIRGFIEALLSEAKGEDVSQVLAEIESVRGEFEQVLDQLIQPVDRRKLISPFLLVNQLLSASLLTTAAAGAAAYNTTVTKEQLVAMSEGEAEQLSENFLRSIEFIFGAMHKNQIAFLDQHGNLIDGPITVPEDKWVRKELPGSTPEKPLYKFILPQEWLDGRRRVIHATYPTVHYDPDAQKEKPELYNQIQNIWLEKEEDEKNPKITLLDIIWRESQEKVWPEEESKKEHRGKTRYEVAQDIFADYDPKTALPPRHPQTGYKKDLEKRRQEFIPLPPDLQDLIVTGVLSQESMYGHPRMQKSPDNAVGPWQFRSARAKAYDLIYTEDVPATDKEGKVKKNAKNQTVYIESTHDGRQDFIESSYGSVQCFTDSYNELRKHSIITKIQTDYELEEEDFLYPCVLDDFHAGRTILVQVLTWFRDNYSKERIERELGRGPYGKSLYIWMTHQYVKQNPGKQYGQESRTYFLFVHACSNLLLQKIADPDFRVKPSDLEKYEPPAVPTQASHFEVPVAQMSLRKRARTFLQPILSGLAAGMAVDMTHNKTLLTGNWRPSRRGLLLTALGTGTGYALSPDIEAELPAPVQNIIPKKLIRSPEFDYGPITHSDDLGRELLKTRIISDANPPPKLSLPRLRQKEFNHWLDNQKPKPRKFYTIKEAKDGQLAFIEPFNSPHYRCFSVGTDHVIDPKTKLPVVMDRRKNNPDLLYAVPHIRQQLETISQKFNAELRRRGLPAHLQVRFIVTALVRPEEYNNQIRNAQDIQISSPKSAHLYGLAADISEIRFDIVDTRNHTFYALADLKDEDEEEKKKKEKEKEKGKEKGKSKQEQPAPPKEIIDVLKVNKKYRYAPLFRAVLIKVLIDMYDNGKGPILLNKEGSHIHIVDKEFDQKA